MQPGMTVEAHQAAFDPVAEARQRLFPPLKSRTLTEAADALAAGDSQTAKRILSRFRETQHPDALNLFADIARRQERFDQAEELMRRCIDLVPGHSGYRFNYAVLLRRCGKCEEALLEVDSLLAGDPKNALYRDQRAKTLHALGRHEEALRLRRESLSEFPGSAQVWLTYGDALRSAGLIDDCVVAYKRALDLSPALGSGYSRLAELKTFRFSAIDTQWMDRQASVHGLSAGDRANLLFALGKAYGDQKRYSESFNSYHRANALRRVDAGADPERLTAHRLNCQSAFTPDFFAERTGWGFISDAPIFIVGMPRSGSTLLEQILSSHSAIEGLGELADLDKAMARLSPEGDATRASISYVQRLKNLPASEYQLIGEAYVELTGRRRKSTRPFFTDKTLTNFTHAGLIHAILPRAKIIDVRRHPLDCGWSCFKSNFPTGQPFSHRLTDIGRHYVDYVKLMQHIDTVLPGTVHRVIYERLVAEPEGEIKRIFEYLQMPFEEQCMRFYENQRPVLTLSVDQVRLPLYDSGIAQWKDYEPWLGPLTLALGDILTAYPDVPD